MMGNLYCQELWISSSHEVHWNLDDQDTYAIIGKVLIHIRSPIIRTQSFNRAPKLYLNYTIKVYKQLKNFRFVFHEKYPGDPSAVINKRNNHFAPEILLIGASPHTFEWTRSKGLEVLLVLGRKVIRWCLANSQTSQWKDSIGLFVNKKRKWRLKDTKRRMTQTSVLKSYLGGWPRFWTCLMIGSESLQSSTLFIVLMLQVV